MIDWNKPLQTRSGKPVRFLGVLEGGEGENRVVAIAINTGAYEYVSSRYYEDGRFSSTPGIHNYLDVINVPPKPVKVERWLNIYNFNFDVVAHSTEEDAKAAASQEAIAVAVKLTGEYIPE